MLLVKCKFYVSSFIMMFIYMYVHVCVCVYVCWICLLCNRRKRGVMYFFFESLHHIIEVYGASVTSQEKSSNLINNTCLGIKILKKYATNEHIQNHTHTHHQLSLSRSIHLIISHHSPSYHTDDDR